MENPRGFFHASARGSGLYPFTAAPFRWKGWKGGCYGLFRYEGWEVQYIERREVWRRNLPFP